MWKILAATVVCVLLSGVQVDAAECCNGYTDADTQLCEQYCCFQLFSSTGVTCCADIKRRVPPSLRNEDECLQSWIQQHIWVPIVSGIVFLLLVVGVCTCCCCCCGCCRRSPAPVYIHTGGAPQTTVAMQQSTVTNVPASPAHYGYDQ